MDGQLGCESVMRCFSPHFVDICALNVVQVAAGGKHTLLLKASGQIIAFGNGKLARVVCMSAGSCSLNHVLRLTIEQKEGKVNDGHQDFAFMEVNCDSVRPARIVVAECNDRVFRHGIRSIFSLLIW